MPSAGVIGLGAMGLPMAENIMGAGLELTLWARRPESAAQLLGRGARWAGSPAELAGNADVLLLSLTNSPDVQQVVAGPEGLLAGAREGSVIVDTSTIAPSVSRDLARQAAERGVYFLDAPVSGGTQGARAGTLSVMIGGDVEGVERARPVLEAIGGRIFHVGPSGAGEVVKLANNILVGTFSAAIAEALVLGVKAGADVATMTEVISASTGQSWQLSNQFPLRAFTGEFKPGFMTDLLVKDLALALDLGAETEVPLFMTALAKQLHTATQAAGYGRDDYTSLLRVLESITGVVVRTENTQ